jgi:hypothetical protein
MFYFSGIFKLKLYYRIVGMDGAIVATEVRG